MKPFERHGMLALEELRLGETNDVCSILGKKIV
jgi:hypothetical protein